MNKWDLLLKIMNAIFSPIEFTIKEIRDTIIKRNEKI